MRFLIYGGDDFGKMVKNQDGNGVDHNHPTYNTKRIEYDFIKKWMYLHLCPQSYGSEANFTWMPPSDLTIICINDPNNGVAVGATDWAIVNWCDFYEFKDVDDLESYSIDHRIHGAIKFPGESFEIQYIEVWLKSNDISILEINYALE